MVEAWTVCRGAGRVGPQPSHSRAKALGMSTRRRRPRSATKRWRTSTAIRSVPVDVASRFALYDNFFRACARHRRRECRNHRGAERRDRIRTLRRRRSAVHCAPRGRCGRGVPMFVDLDPAWGPFNSVDFTKPSQVDQTYANVLLNLEGATLALTKYTQDITKTSPSCELAATPR